MLPQIAQGDANKLWIVPSELGRALEGLGNVVGKLGDAASQPAAAQPAAPRPPALKDSDAYVERPEVVAAEKAVAEAAANVGGPAMGKAGPNGQQD